MHFAPKMTERQVPPTVAQWLAEQCRTWLPGIAAESDRLAVPIFAPNGVLSVGIAISGGSAPYVLMTADASIVAAACRVRALPESLAWDGEAKDVYSADSADSDRELPGLLSTFLFGLTALLWAADENDGSTKTAVITAGFACCAESQRGYLCELPTGHEGKHRALIGSMDAYEWPSELPWLNRPAPEQPQPERDLQLARASEELARILHAVQHYIDGGHGSGRPWEQADEATRTTIRRHAELAVRRADAIRDGHARRRARLFLQDWLRESFRLAWIEETKSADDARWQYLVRSALNRIESLMIATDPAAQMFDVYERVLQFGPDAAFVKTMRIGGAR